MTNDECIERFGEAFEDPELEKILRQEARKDLRRSIPELLRFYVIFFSGFLLAYLTCQ